jgi:outer membrane lipoprotein-sorting protein
MFNLSRRQALVVALFSLALIRTDATLANQPPTSDARGLEIARERKTHDSGWKTSAADMEMVLTSRSGSSTTRNLQLRSLEVDGDGNKSMVIFERPLDVKGTALLTFSHIYKADDQWLFLPTIKRVKRVASNNKSGAFMGSEFAFEDLASYEVDKYNYHYLGEETLDGQPMHKLESYPNYEHSGYSKLISWIDLEHYRVHRIDYYDLRGELLKIHTFTGYRCYSDCFWRADEQLIENQQTGKSTLLRVKKIEIGVPFSDSDFQQSALSRMR